MIAENLMSDSIESVQLAPNGVVTDIYPSTGNEAGKIDLLHDKDRGKISKGSWKSPLLRKPAGGNNSQRRQYLYQNGKGITVGLHYFCSKLVIYLKP